MKKYIFRKKDDHIQPVGFKWREDAPGPFEWVARRDAAKGDWGRLSSVVYANGLFVATVAEADNDYDRRHMIWTSPDGIEWDIHETPTGIPSSAVYRWQIWKHVIYGNNIFVATGGILNATTQENDNYDSMIMTSPDGITWTLRSTPLNTTQSSGTRRPIPDRIAYGNNIFLIFANDKVNLISADGINWNVVNQPIPVGGTWYALCYGNGLFVAASNAGHYSDENCIMTSQNGLDWAEQIIPVPPTAPFTWKSYGFRDIVYGSGLYVAVSEWSPMENAKTPQYAVITSPDGINWTVRETPESSRDWYPIEWLTASYANGLFVVLGGRNDPPTHQCMISYDGMDWSLMTTVYSQRPGWDDRNGVWGDITYGNGKFVAISRPGMKPPDTSVMTLDWK